MMSVRRVYYLFSPPERRKSYFVPLSYRLMERLELAELKTRSLFTKTIRWLELWVFPGSGVARVRRWRAGPIWSNRIELSRRHIDDEAIPFVNLLLSLEGAMIVVDGCIFSSSQSARLGAATARITNCCFASPISMSGALI